MKKISEIPAKQWVKMSIALLLYLLFLVWVKSWLGLIVVPFIIDAFTTRIIKWDWWKQLKNKTLYSIMSWVDAIVFALVAVYFVNIFFAKFILFDCKEKDSHTNHHEESNCQK